MNTVPTSRLVELNAHFDSKLKEIGFARDPRKDEDSALATAGKVAGVGALAAGGLYARGRMAAGKGAPHVGVGATIKGGAQALRGDLSSVAASTGAALAKGGMKLNQAGRSGLAASLKAARAAKAKLPFGK